MTDHEQQRGVYVAGDFQANIDQTLALARDALVFRNEAGEILAGFCVFTIRSDGHMDQIASMADVTVPIGTTEDGRSVEMPLAVAFWGAVAYQAGEAVKEAQKAIQALLSGDADTGEGETPG